MVLRCSWDVKMESHKLRIHLNWSDCRHAIASDVQSTVTIPYLVPFVFYLWLEPGSDRLPESSGYRKIKEITTNQPPVNCSRNSRSQVVNQKVFLDDGGIWFISVRSFSLRPALLFPCTVPCLLSTLSLCLFFLPVLVTLSRSFKSFSYRIIPIEVFRSSVHSRGKVFSTRSRDGWE